MLSNLPAWRGCAGFLIVFWLDCGAAETAMEGMDGSGAAINGAAVSAVELSRRADDDRPDDQYRTELFGRPLTVGGEYEFKSEYQGNYNLDDSEDDQLLRMNQRIELELLYHLSPDLALFLEGKYNYQNDLHVEGGPEKQDSSLDRGEMWLFARRLFGSNWSLQAGRQNFQDDREWWWDEDLDAVRLHYDRAELHAQIAVAQELARVSSTEDDIDPEKEDVFRTLGTASWSWAKKQKVEFFFLDQDDKSGTPGLDSIASRDREDEVDADLTWYGLRALGRVKLKSRGKLHYWLDTGYVRGRATQIDFDSLDAGRSIVDDIDRRDVRGWGADLGVTWETKFPLRPSFTLGYAYGSGDGDTDDSRDGAYQQTGLQDSNDNFRGVDSFRYYGELLRPELSNLSITTLAVGFPLWNKSSVELLLHQYRQVHAARQLRNDRLDTNPYGINRAIGTEFDIVLGIEEWQQLELELVAGLFRAGNAFGSGSGEYASTVVVKLNYNF